MWRPSRQNVQTGGHQPRSLVGSHRGGGFTWRMRGEPELTVCGSLVKRSRELWASEQLHPLQMEWSHVKLLKAADRPQGATLGPRLIDLSHQNGGFYSILIRQIAPLRNAVSPPSLLRLLEYPRQF